MKTIQRSFLTISFIFVSSVCLNAKQISSALKIQYQTIINGKLSGSDSKIYLEATGKTAKSYTDNSGIRQIPQTPEELDFIDYATGKTYQVADLFNGKRIYMETDFSEYPEIIETDGAEEILGHRCKKAKATLRSNSIEIWYTNELGVKGTPLMSHGIVDGLVLKVVRNGNFGLEASNIEQLTENVVIPEKLGEKVDPPLFRHMLTSSFVTEINVFDDEQVSWGNPIKNPDGIQTGKTYRFAGGTIIAKKVNLPKVNSGYQVFAELEQYSNGDAYDRTGTVFVIPEEKEKSFFDALKDGIETIPGFCAANGKKYYGTVATPDFSPTVELLRFFTPFGIREYNEKVKVYGQVWENRTFYKQEITELLPLLQKEMWIGIFIGNYDKGGHKVSLDLKYFPGSRQIDEGKDKKNGTPWVCPLFNTLNIMEMAGQEYGTMFEDDSLRIEFDIPEGINKITLRYISTGHGGWGGGDEFNQKLNEIFVDDKLAGSYMPWNCNCGSFRKYNPSSGNFWNGLSSSDYSRSGWCPGEATNPVFVPLKNINPGKHVIKIAIPIGEREGGSFSHWNVSGTLIGEG